jgi:hypothetical protein
VVRHCSFVWLMVASTFFKVLLERACFLVWRFFLLWAVLLERDFIFGIGIVGVGFVTYRMDWCTPGCFEFD